MAQNSPLLGPSANAGATPLPGASASEAPTAPPSEATASQQSFTSKMLTQAQGRFDAVEKVSKQLGRVRKGLDSLVEKGDSVTSDDVLDEMADLVAHGADPKNLAAMIDGNTQAGIQPMPPGGEPLAGWLRDAEEKIIALAESQLRPALALAQHQLGVAAVHRMVELHAKAQGGSAQPGTPNPLGGASPGGASQGAPPALPQPNTPPPSLLQ